MTHELKIAPNYYKEVVNGTKKFEVRFNDRDFKKGDILVLKEFINGFYTKREVKVRVTYLLKDTSYVQEDYVILSITKI